MIKLLDRIGLDFVKHFSKIKCLRVDHRILNDHNDNKLYVSIYLDHPRSHTGWGWSIKIYDEKFVLGCGNHIREYELSNPYSIPNMKREIRREYNDHMKWMSRIRRLRL